MPDLEQNPASVLKRTDKRTQRTVGFLHAALTKLILQRPYDRIRVSDIIRKANVGRATFYAHFVHKDALLKNQLEIVIANTVLIDRAHPFKIDATALFAHLYDVPKMHRSLTRGLVGSSVLNIAQMILVERIMAADRGDENVPKDLRARFIAGSLFEVVDWWIGTGMKESPAQMQEIFAKLALGPQDFLPSGAHAAEPKFKDESTL